METNKAPYTPQCSFPEAAVDPAARSDDSTANTAPIRCNRRHACFSTHCRAKEWIAHKSQTKEAKALIQIDRPSIPPKPFDG
jgi:hypothetical protein